MIGLKPILSDALNTQLTLERTAIAIYTRLAIGMELVNLTGAAAFFWRSASEENMHARKLIDYLIDRDSTPLIKLVPAQPDPTSNLLQALQDAQQAEQTVTQSIDDLYDLSEQEGDNATCVFLQWFIDEQVKSERELQEIVSQVKRAGKGLGEIEMDEMLKERAQ